ncbi:NADP-dependent oxidoreductase [Rathayibacter sp. YIM 133350]|uniref:NADP-dependent oxidoreductase n=1 Tax=Rathayibacter sp. YIM 133350 TaxID=3131992 RepID=UPI00307DB199
MARAVQFDRFGPTDVLEVVHVDPPHAGPGEVRVRVAAAGLNPVDWKIIRFRQVAEAYGCPRLPAGNGNDFAGVIDEVGDGVEGWSVGDEVFGGHRFFAQADFAVVPAGKLVRKPRGISWEQAGALDIVGRTAWASVRAIDPTPDDTVLVTAAAGGVGVLAAQLAVGRGARVIGTASEANHEFLERLGVTPVTYGEGAADRIRAAAPQGVTAVLDNQGEASIELALELGVPRDRINTIAGRGSEKTEGILQVGGAQANLGELEHMAQLIADGLVFPIDSVFPVERVREAYARLEAGHVRGKVVLAFE